MTQLTDKEAYELLFKYAGEKGISMIKEMIHIAGMEKALENMELSYKNSGQVIKGDFKAWMRQAFNHLQKSTSDTN